MISQQVELKEANAFIAELHRHHKPVVGHRFSVGASHEGKLVGVAICGRPVARMVNAKEVLEVTRLCTDGTPNACSFLYGLCARVAKELGYKKIQTYILASEEGTTLRAAGWVNCATTNGGQWVHTDGKARRTDQPTEPKFRYERQL